MDWLRNAAAKAEEKAREAAKQAQEKFKESGLAEQLAPASSVATDTRSFFSGIGTQVESAFNKGTVNEANRTPGDVSFDKIGPPWVTSHLGLKAFEADMKASMEKLTEGSDEEVTARLKEAPLEEDFDFDFMEPGNTARAMAALGSIPRLKELRHKLVPGKIKEDIFWRNYFYQCDIIVKSYLKMCASSSGGAAREGQGSRYADPSDNFEQADFASDGDALGKSGQDAGMSWEEEMEQELEGIEGDTSGVVSAPGDVTGDIDDDDFEKELGL
mmetsp:Transcript_1760/g.4324  ORF Transcript_1760/g.4324 Transcript_1760/m.4324 type:complete len:272 (+) Transcript_1760:3-818(+)